MYDPKFRLALVLSLLVFFGVIVQIAWTYVFGQGGFQLDQYLHGVPRVGGALMGGFFFVWVSTKLISLEKFKKTGFEEVKYDETGTGFNFPVSLDKFLPEIIAPPSDKSLHPLEVELIGFLNGYRHWPYDITGKNNKTLYQHSMEQWRAIKTLPGVKPIHCIAALAQDLGKVYVYKESRKSFPYSNFWKRDQVSFSKHCEEHGGYSTSVLTTMPSFRKLHKDTQTNQRYRRALLTAIRCKDNPSDMPANCDPLAREIYEYLHMAARKALEVQGEGVADFNPSPEEIVSFEEEVTSFFQAIIKETELNPASLNEDSEGIYLGDGKIILHMDKLVQKYTVVLAPETRNNFNLWNLDAQEHVSWKFFLRALKKHNLMEDTWEEVHSESGLFNLKVNNISFPNSVILSVSKEEYPGLRNNLDSLPKWNGMVVLQQHKGALAKDLREKVSHIDGMLKKLNDLMIPATNSSS